jgi:hypothetical protein
MFEIPRGPFGGNPPEEGRAATGCCNMGLAASGPNTRLTPSGDCSVDAPRRPFPKDITGTATGASMCVGRPKGLTGIPNLCES